MTASLERADAAVGTAAVQHLTASAMKSKERRWLARKHSTEADHHSARGRLLIAFSPGITDRLRPDFSLRPAQSRPSFTLAPAKRRYRNLTLLLLRAWTARRNPRWPDEFPALTRHIGSRVMQPALQWVPTDQPCYPEVVNVQIPRYRVNLCWSEITRANVATAGA